MFSKEILDTISQMRSGRIQVDAYIRPEIIRLNQRRVKTEFCCSGHSRRDTFKMGNRVFQTSAHNPYVQFCFSEHLLKSLLFLRKMRRMCIEVTSTEIIIRPATFLCKVQYKHKRAFRNMLRDLLLIL